MTYKRLRISICGDCRRLVSYRFVDRRYPSPEDRDIIDSQDFCGEITNHGDTLISLKQKMIINGESVK